MNTLELWQRLREEIKRGKTDPQLIDALGAVTDDMVEGNLPWEDPELFVNVCWELAQLELSLGGEILRYCMPLRYIDGDSKTINQKLFQLMRDAQSYDNWIHFHKAIDASHRYVDEALGHPYVSNTH
jgi:hypothetical protein